MDLNAYASDSVMKVILLVIAVLTAVIGTSRYRQFGLERGIVAKINSRTLHEKTVPRGGGIVFGSAFSILILATWLFGGLSTRTMLALALGGAAASAIGFIDDVFEVRALRKLGTHVCLAIYLLVILYPLFEPLLRNSSLAVAVAMSAALLFVPVWLINLYNFIDGIDGFAIIGSVWICAAAIAVMAMTGGDQELLFAFALLGASSLGFLFWNVPPASIFMGDAGSIFLGYSFAALLLTTVLTGQISIWTWIAIMGYFIADTTTTTLSRLFLVRNWYGVHRSHAYQNLARIHKSHAKVTYGVALYHLLWALPLVVWSAVSPAWAPLAAILCLAPGVIWTLRFGPRLSSD
jgi:Fuc2NAc and GlcNAc transferase